MEKEEQFAEHLRRIEVLEGEKADLERRLGIAERIAKGSGTVYEVLTSLGSSIGNPELEIVEGMEVLRKKSEADHVHLALMDLDETRDVKDIADLFLDVRWSTNPDFIGQTIPLALDRKEEEFPETYDPRDKAGALKFMRKFSMAHCYNTGVLALFVDVEGGNYRQDFISSLEGKGMVKLRELDIKRRRGGKEGIHGSGDITFTNILIQTVQAIEPHQEEVKRGYYTAGKMLESLPNGVISIEGARYFDPLQSAIVVYPIAHRFSDMLAKLHEVVDPVTKLFRQDYLERRLGEVMRDARKGYAAGYLTLLKIDNDFQQHRGATRRIRKGITSRGVELNTGYVRGRLGQVIKEGVHGYDSDGFAGRYGADMVLIFTRKHPGEMLSAMDERFIRLPFFTERPAALGVVDKRAQDITFSAGYVYVKDEWRKYLGKILGPFLNTTEANKNSILAYPNDYPDNLDVKAIKEGLPYKNILRA